MARRTCIPSSETVRLATRYSPPGCMNVWILDF